MIAPTFADGCWKGRAAYVIGNGDSRFAPGFPTSFPGAVIGCNVAAFSLFCHVTVALDVRLYHRFPEAFRRSGSECLYVSAAPGTEALPPFVREIKASYDHAWTDALSEGALCHSNTGLTAIHLAALSGASPIYLIGFDMQAPGKLTTSGGGLYPESERMNAEDSYRTMMDAFRSHAYALSLFNIKNANPGSALTMFPKCSVEEACR